jgi:predicted flap endonuclease-1-like 5' DNA nuclease
MTALNLQVALLMAVAYLLGAIIACVVRRALFAGAKVAAGAGGRVDPLPQYVQPTPHARRFGGAAAEAAAARAQAPAPSAPAPAPSAPALAAAPPPAAAAPPQDLENIRGIDAALAAGLAKLGVTRYEQIAGWMRPDIQRAGKALALAPGQINAANWIEQAHALARGDTTLFAARRARGERASAGPTPDEGEPAARAEQPSAPLRAAPAAVPPAVEDRAAFANRAPQAAVPIRPAAAADCDNLQRIGRIDAALEAALNQHGIMRYAQIAAWSAADVERFDSTLNRGGAIARENWVEQAHILNRGGDTAYSRQIDGGDAPARPPLPPVPPAPARPAKSAPPAREPQPVIDRVSPQDLNLRSVRPQAADDLEPGPEAAGRVAAQDKVPRAPPDDLKRIRGIGVLIEKRLLAMGITSYEEVANWTAADIDRVSQSLEFKGRIERENWVEQARILASGGVTEFSRRFDRGETDAGRAGP